MSNLPIYYNLRCISHQKSQDPGGPRAIVLCITIPLLSLPSCTIGGRSKGYTAAEPARLFTSGHRRIKRRRSRVKSRLSAFGAKVLLGASRKHRTVQRPAFSIKPPSTDLPNESSVELFVEQAVLYQAKVLFRSNPALRLHQSYLFSRANYSPYHRTSPLPPNRNSVPSAQ